MKIAIYGYGNLGRGVEAAVAHFADAKLCGVFTRRSPESIKTVTGAPVYSAESVLNFKKAIDVMIICCGSATDLPVITPMLARDFNVVDSFDTHAKIPEHFDRVDTSAREGGNVAVISSGWDPGLFSIARLYSSSALPVGCSHTFWGRGISQGHSDAIRRIEGVVDARQYTVPNEEAKALVREGKNLALAPFEKHTRECYVVAEEGADKGAIEEKIKNMPNYFADYDTAVHFISREELVRDHSSMYHGGSVIRSAVTGVNSPSHHTMEFSLNLESNPEFTGSMLLATARAAHRMRERGVVGCKTLFDISPADLSPLSSEEIRAQLL